MLGKYLETMRVIGSEAALMRFVEITSCRWVHRPTLCGSSGERGRSGILSWADPATSRREPKRSDRQFGALRWKLPFVEESDLA